MLSKRVSKRNLTYSSSFREARMKITSTLTSGFGQGVAARVKAGSSSEDVTHSPVLLTSSFPWECSEHRVEGLF